MLIKLPKKLDLANMMSRAPDIFPSLKKHIHDDNSQKNDSPSDETVSDTDNLDEITTLDEDALAALDDELQQAIKEMTESPADASTHPLSASHSGFSVPILMQSLHVAAANGDITTMRKLIENGANVNEENAKSAMPIAIASMCGHLEAVQLLLQHGANFNDRSYNGRTALHWAIAKYHADVVKELLQAGADPFVKIQTGMGHALDQAFEQLDQLTSQLIHHPTHQGFLKQAGEAIKIIEFIAEYGNHHNVPLVANYGEAGSYQQKYPISVLLEIQSPYIQNNTLRGQLLDTATKLAGIDKIGETYIQAKTFLNTFATGDNYPISLSPKVSIMMHTDGFFPTYITSAMQQSLTKYTQTMSGTDANASKMAQYIAHTYEMASHYAKHASALETAEDAFTRYEAGETVLLPTGWLGHCVAVGFSKSLGCMFVANAGQRDQFDPHGVTFHNITNQDKVDADLFHKILINQNPENLEFEILHMVSDGNISDVIHTEPQEHGNCTYYSFKIALEAVAYVELRIAGVPEMSAHDKAHRFSEQFEMFHNEQEIDLMAHDHSPIPKQAFLDILSELKEHSDDSETMKQTHDYLQEKLTNIADDLHTPTLTKQNSITFHDVLDWVGSKFRPAATKVASASDTSLDSQLKAAFGEDDTQLVDTNIDGFDGAYDVYQPPAQPTVEQEIMPVIVEG